MRRTVGTLSEPQIEDRSWWRRVGSPEEGFRYLKVGGGELRSSSALARIQQLAIPPAWADVHVSPDAGRRIQAWGRDDARRRQYIYSDRHVRERDRRKWRRVLRLGRALPGLRERVDRDLAREGYGRDKVLALVVRFIDLGLFRVGSERYAVRNRTYGIATLRKRQLEIRGDMLVFSYRGKQRKDIRRVVVDERARTLVEGLLELPGDRLFQYLDAEGEPHKVTASAVNRYLEAAAGGRYTSKDLRTFAGTVRAATVLADMGAADSPREAERNVVLCCRLVSQELGNTRAICRTAYIHPAVIEEYLDEGRTIENSTRGLLGPVRAELSEPLAPEEKALVRFLQRFG